MKVDIRRVWQRFIRRQCAKLDAGALVAPAVSPPTLMRLPTTHVEAARSLTDAQVVSSVSYRRRELLAPQTGSHALLLDFSRAFLKELKARNMPFIAHCYVRGEAEQEAAFKRGTTKARFGQSPHNFGCAVDIVHFGKFWDLTEKQWAVVGLIGKDVARRRNIKITWGGDWKFYDPAHWELTEWKDIRKAQAA